MATKTPFKIMAQIQIQRFSGESYTRDIDFSTVVENAIVAHIAQFLGITEAQALAAIEQWRMTKVWLYEPLQ